MVYRNYELSAPPDGLGGLSDRERKFSPRLWNLTAVQAALQNNNLSLTFSQVASDQLTFDLGWRIQHAKGFFCTLQSHHYLCSEWINVGSEPKVNNRPIAYPADVYLMGYNKGLALENPKMRPSVYIKFTVKASTVLVANCHPEKNISDRSR